MFIEDMKERYIVSRWAYLMGEPILSDIEYDKLEKEYKNLYPEDPYSCRSYSFDPCPIELLNKYNRTEWIVNTVMGYMAESIYSVNDEIEYNEKFSKLNERSRLSFKIDGWNSRVSYYNGHIVNVRTRGRGGNHLDIDAIAPMFPKTIPYKGRVAITGELNIPMDKWQAYRLKTGNSDQRSSVRTAIANADIAYLSFLAFDIFIEDSDEIIEDKYTLLAKLGFDTPLYRWVSNFKQLNMQLKLFSTISYKYNYLTDGLVIENSKYQYAIRLGAWKEEATASYVTGYEEKYGMYGIAMVVLMKPVFLKGKNCTRVNITDIANIVENDLEIGAPIAFNIRSAANNALDSTETYRLQKKWSGRYDEYQKMIDEQEELKKKEDVSYV